MKRFHLAQFKALILLLFVLPFIVGPVTQDRSVGGRFALELDGAMVGPLASAEGGEAYSEVAIAKPGPDQIPRKKLSGVKYENITITCGAGMAPPFFEWVRDTLDRKGPKKNGAIVAMDATGKVVYRLMFKDALISEVGFPALDVGSKDAAKLTVKMVIGASVKTKAGDTAEAASKAVGQLGQKKWLPANFRLKIDGLDEAMTRVNKIDAIVITQKVTATATGADRIGVTQATGIEIPNVGVVFPEAYAESVAKWAEDSIVRGSGTERNGTLEFLTSDLQTVLFKLTFSNLGIFKLAPEKAISGTEQIRTLKAEMYCEEMKFSLGK